MIYGDSRTGDSDLSLSHGQVAWVTSGGKPPSLQMRSHLHYLRRLGVPFEAWELSKGRGNLMHYGFDHLIELGVALFCLHRGMRPGEIAPLLVTNRAKLRVLYRRAWTEQLSSTTDEPCVKSRSAPETGGLCELLLRIIHDRHSKAPGNFEVLQIRNFGPLVSEKHPDEANILPLTRLVLQLMALSREAPEIKRSIKRRRRHLPIRY